MFARWRCQLSRSLNRDTPPHVLRRRRHLVMTAFNNVTIKAVGGAGFIFTFQPTDDSSTTKDQYDVQPQADWKTTAAVVAIILSLSVHLNQTSGYMKQ